MCLPCEGRVGLAGARNDDGCLGCEAIVGQIQGLVVEFDADAKNREGGREREKETERQFKRGARKCRVPLLESFDSTSLCQQ